MAAYSKTMAYEKAAEVRDKLKLLDRIASNQRIIAPDFLDRDIWHYAENNEYVAAVLFIMQNGRIVGSREFSSKRTYAADEDYFGRLIVSYYNQEAVLPAEIILPETGLIADYFKDKEVRIILPQSGFRYDLLQIARRNALQILQKKILKGNLLMVQIIN